MSGSGPQEVETARAAVLEAYRRHAGLLSRLAMTMTRNRGLAQDVLQETFLRLFLSRMHGEEIRDERDWLCDVMRSLIADWKTSQVSGTEVALEEAGNTATKESEREAPGLQDLPWAGKAARILAPREQECIQLRAQGLEYREIASAMQIDIGTVGTLLNRAVRKLRRVLNTGEGMP